MTESAARMSRWPALAALVGVTVSLVFSSWLRLDRHAFVLGYALVGGPFLVAYARLAGVRPLQQLRRRWQSGLVVGILLGGMLAHGVAEQPASARPEGLALAGSVLWLGVVYGTLDALLLTIVPVLAVYGARPPEEMRHGTIRLRWAGAALLASLGVAAAYHLGFAEYRGAALLQPLIGNAIVTLGYLLSGSPITPLVAHVMMHLAAVLHGMETTPQLPPHYGF